MGLVSKPMARLSDTMKGERHRIMIPAFLANGACGLLIPNFPDIYHYVPLMMFSSAMLGCIFPNITAYILDIVKPEERTKALALRNTFQDLGIILGSTSIGYISMHVGIPSAMMLSGSLNFLSAGVLYAWNRQNLGA